MNKVLFKASLLVGYLHSHISFYMYFCCTKIICCFYVAIPQRIEEAIVCAKMSHPTNNNSVSSRTDNDTNCVDNSRDSFSELVTGVTISTAVEIYLL